MSCLRAIRTPWPLTKNGEELNWKVSVLWYLLHILFLIVPAAVYSTDYHCAQYLSEKEYGSQCTAIAPLPSQSVMPMIVNVDINFESYMDYTQDRVLTFWSDTGSSVIMHPRWTRSEYLATCQLSISNNQLKQIINSGFNMNATVGAYARNNPVAIDNWLPLRLPANCIEYTVNVQILFYNASYTCPVSVRRYFTDSLNTGRTQIVGMLLDGPLPSVVPALRVYSNLTTPDQFIALAKNNNMLSESGRTSGDSNSSLTFSCQVCTSLTSVVGIGWCYAAVILYIIAFIIRSKPLSMCYKAGASASSSDSDATAPFESLVASER